MLVSESPEFVGRAIVSIASDSKLLKKTGKIHFTTDLANEYGFKDLDGMLTLKTCYPKIFRSHAS